ncbi:MAG TPA: U32 family peptidase [Sulfuricaulis sp.]
MKLSLGPIPYYWERQRVFDFYERIAYTAVDIVYLGETVCSKRRALRLSDWFGIARRLTDAGKEAVLSTLTLIEAESEVSYMRSLVENGHYPVEANDMAAINMLEGVAPFVIGPHVNVYNNRTLELMAHAGARRWVMPLELDHDSLAALQVGRPAGLETEVFVYGRLPLAFSARCFTARAHNLPKDDCGFRCADYPEGLLLRTREGESFLSINGIEILSGDTYNLINEVGAMRTMGVDVLRLAPQPQGMLEIIETFRRVMEGNLELSTADAILAMQHPDGFCDGYWHGTAGMNRVHNVSQ